MVLRADKPSSGLSGGLRHTNHSHHNSNSASPDGEAVLQLPPLALKGRLASLKTSSRGNLVASKRAALRHLPLLCFLSILVLAPMSLWGSFIQMHTSSARGALGSKAMNRFDTTWNGGKSSEQKSDSHATSSNSRVMRHFVQPLGPDELQQWRHRPQHWRPKPGWPNRNRDWDAEEEELRNMVAVMQAALPAGQLSKANASARGMRGRHVDDASAVSFRGFGRKFGTSQAALGKLVSSAKRPLSQHLSASDVWGLGLEGHPNADSHPSKPHAPPQCEPFEDAQTIAIVGPEALNDSQMAQVARADLVIRFDQLSPSICRNKVDIWVLRAASVQDPIGDTLEAGLPDCLSSNDLKGVWFVGSDVANIQRVMEASSSIKDTPYVHFPLHTWQQRYSSRPLAAQQTRDTHNSGLQPSTTWIGITTALECAQAGTQLHVHGMSTSQNSSQPNTSDAKAEQEWLFNLDALGLIKLHHPPCNLTEFANEFV
eukprot:jgi/Astpho2/2832/Aster-x0133